MTTATKATGAEAAGCKSDKCRLCKIAVKVGSHGEYAALSLYGSCRPGSGNDLFGFWSHFAVCGVS